MINKRSKTYNLSRDNRGPLGAISIVLLLGGIAAIFPPMESIFSPIAITLLFMLFLTVNVMFILSVSIFAVHRGGMRFIVTNKRIISVKDFLFKEITDYPYGSIRSAEVIQGVIGKRYDYGDIRIRMVLDGKTAFVTIHGIKNPELAKNSILTLSMMETMRTGEKRRYPASNAMNPHMDIRYY